MSVTATSSTFEEPITLTKREYLQQQTALQTINCTECGTFLLSKLSRDRHMKATGHTAFEEPKPVATPEDDGQRTLYTCKTKQCGHQTSSMERMEKHYDDLRHNDGCHERVITMPRTTQSDHRDFQARGWYSKGKFIKFSHLNED